MILKVLPKEAANLDYLLGKKQRKGKFRGRVIAGSAAPVRALVANSKAKQRFFSAVLSDPDTKLKLDVIEAVVEETLTEYRLGLPPQRVAVFAYQHFSHNTEVHLLFVELDLLTGKKFQPYIDRLDRTRFTLFQELLNVKYNLTMPVPKIVPSIDPWQKKEFKLRLRELYEAVGLAYDAGRINGPADLHKVLTEAGATIHKQHRDHLFVKTLLANGTEAWLDLKGVPYHSVFSREKFENEIARLAKVLTPEERQLRVDGLTTQIAALRERRWEMVKDRYEFKSRQSFGHDGRGPAVAAILRRTGSPTKSSERGESAAPKRKPGIAIPVPRVEPPPQPDRDRRRRRRKQIECIGGIVNAGGKIFKQFTDVISAADHQNANRSRREGSASPVGTGGQQAAARGRDEIVDRIVTELFPEIPAGIGSTNRDTGKANGGTGKADGRALERIITVRKSLAGLDQALQRSVNNRGNRIRQRADLRQQINRVRGKVAQIDFEINRQDQVKELEREKEKWVRFQRFMDKPSIYSESDRRALLNLNYVGFAADEIITTKAWLANPVTEPPVWLSARVSERRQKLDEAITARKMLKEKTQILE